MNGSKCGNHRQCGPQLAKGVLAVVIELTSCNFNSWSMADLRVPRGFAVHLAEVFQVVDTYTETY